MYGISSLIIIASPIALKVAENKNKLVNCRQKLNRSKNCIFIHSLSANSDFIVIL